MVWMSTVQCRRDTVYNKGKKTGEPLSLLQRVPANRDGEVGRGEGCSSLKVFLLRTYGKTCSYILLIALTLLSGDSECNYIAFIKK